MAPLLEGIRVLDLTRVLAGPFASMTLADLGAEVVKIERPGTGDDSRSFGPFLNGESVTLDLKSAEGAELFKRLVGEFDVVIENFRPGTMEKLGLGYEVLRDIHPGIIYAAVSGFGQTGPYSAKPAYDIVIQAMGGMMSITGTEDGRRCRVGASIGDITAGLYCCIGVLGALLRRSSTGEGCYLDVAMLDCQVSILENAIARFLITGEVPAPLGSRHPSITPFDAFDAADGQLIVAAGNDELWKRVCTLVERPELAGDPRFVTNELRTSNQRELKEELAPEIRKRSVDEWCGLLDGAGIPGGPVSTIDRVCENPQVRFRDMLVRVDHPRAGSTSLPGNPIKMGGGRPAVYSPAPPLGGNTEEILGRLLGPGDATLSELKHRGVV
jgi:CoA:oxalate CoA-transferase